MIKEKIFLRNVEAKDIKLLFEWANNKEVRQNSFNTGLISYEEHSRWFKKLISSNDEIQYILMADDVAVGQIRFSVNGNRAKISYSIDPTKRKRGYGKEIIRLAAEKIRIEHPEIDILVARIKSENIISSRCFEVNDFYEVYRQFELKLK